MTRLRMVLSQWTQPKAMYRLASTCQVNNVLFYLVIFATCLSALALMGWQAGAIAQGSRRRNQYSVTQDHKTLLYPHVTM